MSQLFRAKYPEIQVVEVAVIADGKPTDEHGFVHRGTGRIIDAETFLELYEPAQPVSDSGKRRGRQPGKRRGRPPGSGRKPAKAKAAPVVVPATTRATRPPKKAVEKAKTECPTVSACVRAALAAGPKDLAAIIEYVQNHGFDGIEDRNISNIVYQLRQTQKLTRSDDGTYSLPEA